MKRGSRNPFQRILDFISLVLAALFSAAISLISLPFWLINWNWGIVCLRMFGWGWLWIMGIRREVHGLENIPAKPGYILAANHESMFDIPLLASLPLKFHWIAKREVVKIPFVGLAVRMMKCYLVARNKSSKDLLVMAEVEAGLKRGNNTIVFPEGTRTRTGDLQAFKKGPFRLAAHTGAPLIPIAITGTYAIAPPGSWPTRNHKVTVRIGKPLLIPSEMPIEEAQALFRAELIKLLSLDRGSDYNGALNTTTS